jgi:Spy/CpxP family protein refolding chaperone
VNNWKVILATVVIFGAGVVTGGLLVNCVKPSHPKTMRHPAATAEVHPSATNQPPRVADAAKPPRLPEILSRPFLQRLDEELHLAPDEREAIQKIINEGQNQMRKVIQDSRLEIREVLTPEQRKQFDELVKRPFHKPIFDTNAPAGAESDFKTRLEKIIAAQRTNVDEPAPNSPSPPPAR